MTIIDTIQTTAAASGQPLNLAHLDVLRTVLLANSPSGGDLGDPLTEAELRHIDDAYPPDSLIGRLVHQARLMLAEQDLEIERDSEAETTVRAAHTQREALLAELAILRHALSHPVIFEAVTASCRMIQELHAGEPDVVRVYTQAWRDFHAALMGQSLSEAALRMWRGDQALISHMRTTLQPLWFALLDLPRQDEEDAPCPVTLNLAVWCRIAAALGDAFGSRAVETPPHDWEAFLLSGVALQERGTLASLLIGDYQLTLTLDETVISFTEVTSVLPGRAALADMVGAAVEIKQVGHASYLVRSQTDTSQVIRVTTAGARTPRAIARGVLSEITLGPAGLSLNVGTKRVTFMGLGAFPPAGLDRLRGHEVTITASARGCYGIAGYSANETILATTIAVGARPTR